MLIQELTLYKAKFQCIKSYSELILPSHQNKHHAKGRSKTIPTVEEDEIGLLGRTNLEEAKEHTDTLDDTLERLEEIIREGATENIMRKMIVWFRKAIIKITPSMEEANADTVLNSIKDIARMALMPQTEERDERLEEIVPEEDLPSASDIVAQAQELEDLTLEQREKITELFDELEVAHYALAKVSSTQARLSRSLSGKQLLMVLRSSICPLIQINTLGNFWKD